MSGRGRGKQMANNQPYIDPRYAFSGKVSRKPDDINRVRIVEFNSDPLSQKDYALALQMTTKYFKEYITIQNSAFKPEEKSIRLRRSSYGLDYRLNKEFSEHLQDYSIRQFSILEVLSEAGFEPKDCVQLLEMITDLFDFPGENEISEALDKLPSKSLEEKDTLQKRACAHMDYLSSAQSKNKFNDVFISAYILAPRNNYDFYNSFVNYFINGIKYDRRENASQDEKDYLAKEIKNSRASLINNLLKYVSNPDYNDNLFA